VPAAWVAGDDVYGDDGGVRGWLEEQRRPSVLAVSCAHQIQDGPYRGRVDGIVADLPEDVWIQLSAVRYLDEEAAYLMEVEEGRREADAGLFVPEDEMNAFWTRFAPPSGATPITIDISEEELRRAQRVAP